MVDQVSLLKQIETLLPSQIGKLSLLLNFDEAHFPINATPTEYGLTLIKLSKQREHGLQELQDALDKMQQREDGLEKARDGIASQSADSNSSSSSNPDTSEAQPPQQPKQTSQPSEDLPLKGTTNLTRPLGERRETVYNLIFALLNWNLGKISLKWSLLVVAVIVSFRIFGFLESSELFAFDRLLYLCRFLNDEGKDKRILIVEIGQGDYDEQLANNDQGDSRFLKDKTLERLLNKIKETQSKSSSNKAPIVGLDLYRDFKAKILGLDDRLKEDSNLIGVCDLPDSKGETNSKQTSFIPKERIGFADILRDSPGNEEGFVRRHWLLAEPSMDTRCEAEESFSLLLARRYLEQRGHEYTAPVYSDELSNWPLKIDRVSFKRFLPSYIWTGGAYQFESNTGYQILLNYRHTDLVAEKVGLKYFLDNYSLEEIRDRVILVGADRTFRGAGDIWNTPYGEMTGLEVHAHMVSQILNAVLNNRHLLWVLPSPFEWIWIWAWSFVGGILPSYLHSRKCIVLATAGVIIILLPTLCWLALSTTALWLPLIPPTLGLLSTEAIVFVWRGRGRSHRSLSQNVP